MRHTDRKVHGSSGRLWVFIQGRWEHAMGSLPLVTPGACNNDAPNINITFNIRYNIAYARKHSCAAISEHYFPLHQSVHPKSPA